jgi:catechol 2,3-dioxygenase-like lactoylglutathione lyase family enzyme
MHLNHTIVHARDKQASADFFAELLGLAPARRVGPFAMLQIDADLSLDFIDAQGHIQPQHYAFLVTEAEFDAIFGRIQARRLRYWADPNRREADRINTWDDGRGVYFDDPDGHLLELITRPYGSGGTTTQAPHPLFRSTSAS